MSWEGQLDEELRSIAEGTCEVVETDRLPTPALARSWEVVFRLQTAVLYARLSTAERTGVGGSREDLRAYRLFTETVVGATESMGGLSRAWGEGIIALFDPRRNPASRATACALRIHRFLERHLDPLLPKEGPRPVYGIAVDRGEVLAAKIGYVRHLVRTEIAWVGRPLRTVPQLSREAAPPLAIALSSRAYNALPDGWRRRPSYLRELVLPLWRREVLRDGRGPAVYLTRHDRWPP